MTTPSEFFKQTSDAPYGRHNYEILLKTGKTVFFENWEDVQGYWWQHCQIPDFLNLIIVIDKKKNKNPGFG